MSTVNMLGLHLRSGDMCVVYGVDSHAAKIWPRSKDIAWSSTPHVNQSGMDRLMNELKRLVPCIVPGVIIEDNYWELDDIAYDAWLDFQEICDKFIPKFNETLELEFTKY